MPGVSLGEARGPDGLRVYAIGDVHGRLDLLTKMHAAIADEIAVEAPADWRIVHLGDYVDRGPESRGVIDFLIAARERDARNVALAGNHDIGMLDFLAEPRSEGLFANFGGAQTLQSYGVAPRLHGAALWRTHAAFAAAVPPAHVAFLHGLGRSTAFGDFFFCHAGIRPRIPLDDQSPGDLVWIRGEFHGYAGLHPKVIVHGHTPTLAPDLRGNRVNIDTGAWTTGVLTAFAVEGRRKRLISVSEGAEGAVSEAVP